MSLDSAKVPLVEVEDFLHSVAENLFKFTNSVSPSLEQASIWILEIDE